MAFLRTIRPLELLGAPDLGPVERATRQALMIESFGDSRASGNPK